MSSRVASVPPAPTLIGPVGAGTSAEPTYRWLEAEGATSYWLWVWDSGSGRVFSERGFDAAAYCLAGACSAAPSFPLTSGDTYWWVLASNEAGNGPWSSYLKYTVDGAASAFDVGIYPQGERFPLIVLAFDNAYAAEAIASGWNVAHSYYAWTPQSVPASFVAGSAAGKLLSMGSLDAPFAGDVRTQLPESEVAGAIAELSAAGRVAWWDLPEELRYWKASEMATVQSYASWTRLYDAQRRPNSMYIPGHYPKAALEEYLPHLDILPVSVYTTYYGQPHAWVRWRVESSVRAINDRGYAIGRDYLAGEKTPVAYLEIYTGSTTITPQGSYHDFWQSIVSGARGVLVYSYAYKDSSPTLAACWQRLSDAARQLSGTANLERAILYGTRQTSASATVLSGPTRTPSFDAPDEGTIDYPAIDVLAVTYGGELFVIAVNSSIEPVTARIDALSSSSALVQVLFEGRTISVASGGWDDSFEPLGVHIYRQSL